MEDDIVFSLNKSWYASLPPRIGPYFLYTPIVVDPDNSVGALNFLCEEQICDLSNTNAPCFVNVDDCLAWGNYQGNLNGGNGGGGGGGGGGDGGGGGSSGSSGGDCSAPQCPCPGPAPICGSGDGCCCGVNQFCGGVNLVGFEWVCSSCNCVPGSVFGSVPGTCVNPWGPGGGDGVGGT